MKSKNFSMERLGFHFLVRFDDKNLKKKTTGTGLFLKTLFSNVTDSIAIVYDLWCKTFDILSAQVCNEKTSARQSMEASVTLRQINLKYEKQTMKKNTKLNSKNRSCKSETWCFHIVSQNSNTKVVILLSTMHRESDKSNSKQDAPVLYRIGPCRISF